MKLPKRINTTYEVGMNRFSVVDENRDETLGNAEGKRHIEIQVLYPVNKDDTKELVKLEYTNEKRSQAIKSAFHVPSTELKDITVNIYKDAKITSGKFPLVLFSHGLNSYIESNTALCCEMAAAGYIVASVGHAFEGVYNEYEDGTFDYYDKSINKKMYTKGMWKAVKAQLKIMKKTLTLEESDEAFGAFEKEHTSFICNRTVEWSKDMLYALKCIKERYNDSLDLTKGVAASGHSLGGATAYYLCQTSDEISCGLNIDGALFGRKKDITMTKPFYLFSCKENWNFESSVLLRTEAPVYAARYSNMKHLGFTDAKFIKGLSMICGSLNPEVMHKHLTEGHISFLNKYLKGEDIQVAESNSEEIVIETLNA